MRINWPQLLLIHTICPAIHRLFIVREINAIKTAIVHTNTIHLPALRNQQLQFIQYNSSPSLLPQIILKCTTTQSPSKAVNKVLFSLRGAIDMNRDSYINSRLLFQSPPRWGLGQTLHDSARTLLLLFTLGLCLPGNHWPTVHQLPAPAVTASQENPWAK